MLSRGTVARAVGSRKAEWTTRHGRPWSESLKTKSSTSSRVMSGKYHHWCSGLYRNSDPVVTSRAPSASSPNGSSGNWSTTYSS